MDRSNVETEKEKKEFGALKTIIIGVLVFVVLGITLANQMLGQFGLEDNYAIVFSAAFVIAALLLSKSMILLVLVAVGVVAVNLPDATLVSFGLDRDVLLAVVCAVVLVPSLYDLISK
ncbi:MAG: hypothetical protein GKR91_04580 [Pseudomonadales bacterium]|nr:hypothetical protein [Pseudomonadales bacterium]